MGLLDALQLGEALRLPFLHADLFLGELRGEAFGLGLFGECLALCDGEAAAQLTQNVSRSLLAAKSTPLLMLHAQRCTQRARDYCSVLRPKERRAPI